MTDLIKTVRVTSDFTKSFRKLPRNIQDQAENKDKKFRENPFTTSLKTHRLKGELEGFYSYSVSYHHRVLFKLLNRSTAVYYDIGTHEIYR